MSILKKIAKRIVRGKPLISSSQYVGLVKKMDSGDFVFSEEEESILIKLWHLNNSTVPIPKCLKHIFDSQNALKMNEIEVAELTFKLPYGIAYELRSCRYRFSR